MIVDRFIVFAIYAFLNFSRCS